MKNLQALVIVALGLVLFSSCARGYGCPYSTIDSNEMIPNPTEKVVPVNPATSRTTASAEIATLDC